MMHTVFELERACFELCEHAGRQMPDMSVAEVRNCILSMPQDPFDSAQTDTYDTLESAMNAIKHEEPATWATPDFRGFSIECAAFRLTMHVKQEDTDIRVTPIELYCAPLIPSTISF